MMRCQVALEHPSEADVMEVAAGEAHGQKSMAGPQCPGKDKTGFNQEEGGQEMPYA